MFKIRSDDNASEELVASCFGHCLAKKELFSPLHRHSFFQLFYFTKGAGKLTIDFVDYKIEPGLIYVMIPGQVHSCDYPIEIDGYVVNFSEILFSEPGNTWKKLEEFPFFSGNCEKQVMQLQGEEQEQIVELFEKILGETKNLKDHAIDMIHTLWLQLFIIVGRIAPSAHPNPTNKSGYRVLQNFQKLSSDNFTEKKLPSEYASLLYVTPNYLNALCSDLLGISAAEVIRKKVLLKAKKLLLNGELNITEIAHHLNFNDNSYFTKFFKKYEYKTPEEFRKQNNVVFSKQPMGFIS